MSEARQLEVRPGDMVLASISRDGEAVTIYMGVDANLDSKLDLIRRYLLAQGHAGVGPLGEVDDYGDSQWAVDVRNFLDNLIDPEGYGWALASIGPETRAEITAEVKRLLGDA